MERHGLTEGFQNELQALLNKHSLENDSDTPDYILATYLGRCLDAFSEATTWRTDAAKTEGDDGK